MQKQPEASFWTTEDIDLASDLKDQNNRSKNEHFFVFHVLAYFAASDGIVNENFGANFATDLQIPEARIIFGFQIAVENIYSETSSFLNDTYVPHQKMSKAGHLRLLQMPFLLISRAAWKSFLPI